MRQYRLRHAARLLPGIAAMLASAGMVLAQDQLPAAQVPATNGVTFNGVPVNDSGVGDAVVIPEAAAATDTVPPLATAIPVEEVPPAAPQSNTELPPLSAEEMADEDRDDLLRGPVHEAFAEQVNSDPTPNMIVNQEPPEPVEELPPELKPNGREV